MEATTKLLDEKALSEISIQEIVAEAGCSVGAFYGRFKDKESLLHALDEQYALLFISMIENLMGENAESYTTLRAYITAIIQTLYDLHTEQRGLMRALILTARSQTDCRFRAREERINATLPPVFMKILSFREQIKYPNPEMAIQFGLLQTHFSLREMVLWDHLRESVPVSGDALVQELVRGYLNYLEYQEEDI